MGKEIGPSRGGRGIPAASGLVLGRACFRTNDHSVLSFADLFSGMQTAPLRALPEPVSERVPAGSVLKIETLSCFDFFVFKHGGCEEVGSRKNRHKAQGKLSGLVAAH